LRKFIAILTSGLLLYGLGPASAAPQAFAGAEQTAIADWVDMDGRRGTYVAMLAGRFLDSGGGFVTVAAVARGSCQRSRSGHMALIACHGRGKAKEIPFSDFVMDPAMSTATVTARIDGYRHSARWTGKGRTPVSNGGVSGDDQFLAAGAGMYRNATSVGKVYQRRVASGGGMDWGEMAFGAGAILVPGAGPGQPQISLSGDRFTVTRTIEIRR
jgi:hypothetical protein